MAIAAPKPLPFDSIELREDGAWRALTERELIAMSLNDRVHLLIEGRLRFSNGAARVDPQLAMRAVYQRARRSTGTHRIVTPSDDE